MRSLISILKKFLERKALYVLLWCLIFSAVYVVYFAPSDSPTAANKTQTSPAHVLCVLVPYRDRFEELLEFVPHMSKFLNRQSIKYHILVINHLQDGYRFNKGASLNAGFHIMRKKLPECDYIAINDIDTLPLTDEVSYAYPGESVYHGIPVGLHPVPVYAWSTYVGGILLVSNDVFIRMNGFGNNFWGWGFVDMNFQLRMEKHSVPLIRPEKFATNDSAFKHTHGKFKKRDTSGCSSQLAIFTMDQSQADNTGLNDVNYTFASENYLIFDGFPAYLFNVNIKCIFEVTPWCRPFCKDNATTTKTFWEWDENDLKNPMINSTNAALVAFYEGWTRLFNPKYNDNRQAASIDNPFFRSLGQ